METPITRLITEVLIFPTRSPSKANGTTIAATVISPTIQVKKTRGRGVVEGQQVGQTGCRQDQTRTLLRHSSAPTSSVMGQEQGGADQLDVKHVAEEEHTDGRHEGCDARRRHASGPQPASGDGDSDELSAGFRACGADIGFSSDHTLRQTIQVRDHAWTGARLLLAIGGVPFEVVDVCLAQQPPCTR